MESRYIQPSAAGAEADGQAPLLKLPCSRLGCRPLDAAGLRGLNSASELNGAAWSRVDFLQALQALQVVGQPEKPSERIYRVPPHGGFWLLESRPRALLTLKVLKLISLAEMLTRRSWNSLQDL